MASPTYIGVRDRCGQGIEPAGPQVREPGQGPCVSPGCPQSPIREEEQPRTQPILRQRRRAPVAVAQVLLAHVVQIQVGLVGPVSKGPLVLLGAGVPILHAVLRLFQRHDLQATGGSPVRHRLGGPVPACGGLGRIAFLGLGQGRVDPLPFVGSPFALAGVRGPVGELLDRGSSAVPQELGGAGLLPRLEPLVLSQVQPVELIDELLTVQQVVLRLPSVLRAPVAFPPDQVLPFSLLVLPLVYNPFDLGCGRRIRKEREKEKIKIKSLPGHKNNTRTEVSVLATGARRLTLPGAFEAGLFQEIAEGNQRHTRSRFP